MLEEKFCNIKSYKYEYLNKLFIICTPYGNRLGVSFVERTDRKENIIEIISWNFIKNKAIPRSRRSKQIEKSIKTSINNGLVIANTFLQIQCMGIKSFS